MGRFRELLASDSELTMKPIREFLGFDSENKTESGWATLYDNEGAPYRVHIEEKVAEAAARKAEKQEKAKKEMSFQDRLKKILNTPFKSKNPARSVSPEFIKEAVSKLDPNNKAHEEALKTLEKYYDEGDPALVEHVANNLINYTSDPKKYDRSLKINERNLNKTLDILDRAEKKINELTKEDEEKLADVMYREGQRRGSNLTKEQIAERLTKIKKEGKLLPLMQGMDFNSEGLRLAHRITDTKNLINRRLEQIKNFTPADSVLWSINQDKKRIKDVKDSIESYLRQNNMAMDSADFAELTRIITELENSLFDYSGE